MSAPEPRRYNYSLNLSLLLILIALACFAASECVLQGWLTLGTGAQWFVGGFIASTLAKIL